MQRRILAALAAVLVTLGLATAPASAETADPWYLALGDSYAAGYQPGVGDDLTGGYAGGVLDAYQALVPGTQLKNLACSGETVDSFLDGGTHCAYDGSQLDAALDFLETHPGTTLITLDIGGNNVQRCVSRTTGGIDFACLNEGMQTIRTRLPVLISQLQEAAPQAQIVLATYPNVFLAAWLTGADGQNLARLSMGLFDNLNGIFAATAEATGVDLADVSEAFSTHDFTLVSDPAFGEIPQNVSKVCSLTWMCARQDIHANDAGYTVIADVIADLLRAPAPTPDPDPSPSGDPSPSQEPSAPSSTTTDPTSPTTTDPTSPTTTTPAGGPQTPALVQTDSDGASTPTPAAALVLLLALGALPLVAGQARRRGAARH